jgi:hypothetical protein
MKYNIYSPNGRTGSIRLMSYINGREGFVKDDLHGYDLYHSSYNTIHRDHIFKHAKIKNGIETLIREKKLEFSIVDNILIYIFPKELRELVCDGMAIHSHTCMWTEDCDWTNILSSRRDKTELPMSLAIAVKSGDWSGDPNYKGEITPFILSECYYLSILKYCEGRERAFIKGVKRDTGKEAIIIYLEDTPEEIEEKLGIKIPKHIVSDRNSNKSKFRAKDYIINYDELKVIYNDFINNKEYHMNNLDLDHY